MFDTVVVATDGSESVSRAADCALDLAARFDAAVHALYVLDETQVESLPEDVHDEVRDALDEQSTEALEAVATTNRERPDPVDLETTVRVGRPTERIISYAEEVDADVVAVGTRGRHGEHSFLLGSVAERVVRTCPVPVLTVRQLD
jgi:nucleotide-binding universal stress UspA family protein